MIEICVAGILFVLGSAAFLGWAEIVCFSPKVRTIVFWSENIVAGILVLDYIVTMGIHISWGYHALMALAVGFGIWLGEKYPKHPNAQIERRGIISAKEDILLLLDALIIWGGLPLAGVQITFLFIGK